MAFANCRVHWSPCRRPVDAREDRFALRTSFSATCRAPEGKVRLPHRNPKTRGTSSCECLGDVAAHHLARVQMYFRLHPPKLIWFCLDQWGGLVHRSSPYRRATADEYQRRNGPGE